MQSSPYRGLEPYTEDDWEYFFGRERECDIISANLTASRLTLLYGASGVGKTSVLRAGVAHQLARHARDNRATYGTPEHAIVVFSTWRDDPIASLQASIAAAVADALGEPPVESPAVSASLIDVLPAWSACVGGDVLIILDQFEEYFLYHGHEQGPGTFDYEFPRVVNRPDLQVNFLIGIREDALARLDRFKGRVPDLFANYLRLEHLDRDAAQQAIERPLRQYNHSHGGLQISIEAALTDAVLNDLANTDNARDEAGRGMLGLRDERQLIDPSYLQVVMTRLWLEEVRAGSSILRLETFEGLGTAHDILETHLDETMRGLDEDHRASAAAMFHHLVTPSGSKIAHNARDLAGYAAVDQERVDHVLAYLSHEARILRSLPPFGRSDEPRYEIYHDRLADAVLGWRSRYLRERELADEQARNEEQLRALQAEADRKIAEVEARADQVAAQAVARARRDALAPIGWNALFWITAVVAGIGWLVVLSAIPGYRISPDAAPALIFLAGCVPIVFVAALVVLGLIRTSVSRLRGWRFLRLALFWALMALSGLALVSGLLGAFSWADQNVPLFRQANPNTRAGFEAVAVLLVMVAWLVIQTIFTGGRTFKAIEQSGGYDAPVPPPSGTTYAGVPRRAVAMLMDCALLVLVGLALIAASTVSKNIYAVFYVVAFLVIVWLYAPVLESTLQATIGKRALQLRVVDLQGERVTFARANARHLAKVLSWALLFGGFVMAITPRSQALHDRLAGTLVIGAAKPRPQPQEGLSLGGFWSRAAAGLIDTISLLLAIGIPIGLFNQAQRSSGYSGEWLIVLCAGWLYTAAFETSRLQGTPGKLLMGLRVTDLQGRRISFWRASWRYAARVFSLLPLLIGYISASSSKHKQTFHDRLAGTLVVNARRSRPATVDGTVPLADVEPTRLQAEPR